MPQKNINREQITSFLKKSLHSLKKNKEELSKAESIIVDNVANFIRLHEIEISTQYLSVKTQDGLNKPLEIYDTIDEKAYLDELMRVSAVILTANYFESEILNLSTSSKNGKRIKQLNNGISLFEGGGIVKAYLMEIGDYNVLHLNAPETGSNTPCGSSDLARYVRACEYLNPSCIVSFGICFGIDPEQHKIGHTIVAKKLYPWSVALKISNDYIWQVKSDDYSLNLSKEWPNLYKQIDEKAKAFQGDGSGQCVWLGNMITSEAVISSEKVKNDAIDRSHGHSIIGGEMEGYGLAKECIHYNKTPCIVLKAICDWGAVKDIDQYLKSRLPNYNETAHYKDRIQAYAAHCAYQFLEILFTEKLVEKNDLIYNLYKKLANRYQADYVISKEMLTQFLNEELYDSSPKYRELCDQKRKEMLERVTSIIIEEYLLEDEVEEMYAFLL